MRMQRAANTRARLWVAAVAGAGVVASHGIAYRITAPGALQRAELLDSTGHRYFSLLVAAVSVALVIGLGAFVAESLAAGRASLAPRRLFSYTLVRLTGLQAAGFLVLEALERLMGGEHHFASALLSEPATLLGVALQLLSALIAAALLVLLRRVIVTITASRRGRRRSSVVIGEPPGALPRLSSAVSDAAPRAPPAAWKPRIAASTTT
jgi:hypothetical protein